MLRYCYKTDIKDTFYVDTTENNKFTFNIIRHSSDNHSLLTLFEVKLTGGYNVGNFCGEATFHVVTGEDMNTAKVTCINNTLNSNLTDGLFIRPLSTITNGQKTYSTFELYFMVNWNIKGTWSIRVRPLYNFYNEPLDSMEIVPNGIVNINPQWCFMNTGDVADFTDDHDNTKIQPQYNQYNAIIPLYILQAVDGAHASIPKKFRSILISSSTRRKHFMINKPNVLDISTPTEFHIEDVHNQGVGVIAEVVEWQLSKTLTEDEKIVYPNTGFSPYLQPKACYLVEGYIEIASQTKYATMLKVTHTYDGGTYDNDIKIYGIMSSEKKLRSFYQNIHIKSPSILLQ